MTDLQQLLLVVDAALKVVVDGKHLAFGDVGTDAQARNQAVYVHLLDRARLTEPLPVLVPPRPTSRARARNKVREGMAGSAGDGERPHRLIEGP
jgi:hypothetical protein